MTENASRGNGVTFAFIGSLIPSKGIDVLIKSFRKVNDKNIRLKIFGRQITNSRYVKELKQLALNDTRIEFMGPFSPEQREGIYKNIDVLVVPSLFPETFSLVIREALSLGKPVIASRIGALPEVIIDKANGFLFEPGNEQQLSEILGNITREASALSTLDCPGPTQIATMEEHINAIQQIYFESL